MKADSCSSLYAVTVIFAAIMVSSCASRPDVLPEAPGSREQASVVLFRPDTPSIVGIAEVPFVYLDGRRIGRLPKGRVIKIFLPSGSHEIELRSSFLRIIPFYRLGRKALTVNSSREQYILFQANTDTAHEFGQTPPLTVFTVVEKDQFLQYGESVGSIHYFQEDVTHER